MKTIAYLTVTGLALVQGEHIRGKTPYLLAKSLSEAAYIPGSYVLSPIEKHTKMMSPHDICLPPQCFCVNLCKYWDNYLCYDAQHQHRGYCLPCEECIKAAYKGRDGWMDGSVTLGHNGFIVGETIVVTDCVVYGPKGTFTCGPTCDMECMEKSGDGTKNSFDMGTPDMTSGSPHGMDNMGTPDMTSGSNDKWTAMPNSGTPDMDDFKVPEAPVLGDDFKHPEASVLGGFDISDAVPISDDADF